MGKLQHRSTLPLCAGLYCLLLIIPVLLLVEASPLVLVERQAVARVTTTSTSTFSPTWAASTDDSRQQGEGGVVYTTVTQYQTLGNPRPTRLRGPSTSTSPARSSSSSSSSSSRARSSSSSSAVPPSPPPAASSTISKSSTNTNTDSGSGTPKSSLLPGQDLSDSKEFIVYNVDAVHYPFTVHPPDRSTRNLPSLPGPPPLMLSLSGSGARGSGYDAKMLSGYDGASRKIREYNAGNRSLAHTLAAEEFLTVTPICPNETDQANAQWDVAVLPNILAQVVDLYEVDLTRIYLSTYSMGARAAWNLLMQNPDIFAGTIISSGANFADSNDLSKLLGNSIRNYYGGDDESNLSTASNDTQVAYDAALTRAMTSQERTLLNTSWVLQTEPPVEGADHLLMTSRPWDEDIIVDGFPGALSWLLNQSRPEGANIPAYNASICTTCIPKPFYANATIY